ncbi:MAG: hypothetical protein ACJASC_000452 [Limimaricola cinnabarinus]|jgi:hypothetical protein|uniref:porin n=1 Tax=Limimaricola cinnabarinus TaxID=1125964 RepID=UPI0039E45D2A
MKRILLASASIVAFAGAAAAEITFSGEAALGYNDTDAISEDDEDKGFYWDAELGITFSQELDNGLVAAATVTSDVVDNQLEGDIFAEGFVLSLTSETAGLYFGDTDQAANLRWDGVSEMANDGFSETDGETVLRGDFMAYGLDVSLSALVDDSFDGDENNLQNGFLTPEDDTLDQYSVGVAGEFGAFQFSMAYQAEENDFNQAPIIDNGDFEPDELIGVSVGSAFAGADVDVAYARNLTTEEDSTGIEAAYPIGPVTLGAFYVAESDQDDGYGVAVDYVSGALTVTTAYEEVDGDEDWAIDAGYDFGMGLNFFAGVSDAGDDYYVAGTYALAEGAQLLVSYGDDDSDDSEDEIGDPEFQEGTTVEVSFEF